jgi:hypothetical protein
MFVVYKTLFVIFLMSVFTYFEYLINKYTPAKYVSIFSWINVIAFVGITYVIYVFGNI